MSTILTAIFAALGGSLAGAGALAWLTRQRAIAEEPPSASFEEWIAAVVLWEEASREKAARKNVGPAAAIQGESR